MKKWYFSKNGEVIGPLNLKDAKELLTKDPDHYGWHPSFTQWQPVSCISEFDDVVPVPVPAAQIPKELIEEFVVKKQQLHDKLESLNENIDVTHGFLYEFEQEIGIYKRLTQNLSDEVKGNINSIENQYKALQKQLNQLIKVTDIAETEINDIATDFDNRVASKGSESPAKPQKKVRPSSDVDTAEKSESKIKLVSNDKNTSEKPVEEKSQAKAKIELVAEPTPNEEIVDVDKEIESEDGGFSGVKSIFKSVFKGDSGSDEDGSPKNSLRAAILADDEHHEETEEEKASRVRRRSRRRR